MLAHGLHSSKSSEHYTPAEQAEIVRYVLGGTIDYDFASSRQANRVVKATRIYTAKDDALRREPKCKTGYLNAPGQDNGRSVQRFWEWLVALWMRRRVRDAIWAGFQLGQLQSLQRRAVPPPQRFLVATPGTRIKWLDSRLTVQPHPGHGNYFALLSDDRRVHERFIERYSEIGEVQLPHRPARR